MPDIFVSSDTKKEKGGKPKYSFEEEHPVMLHSEDVLKELRKEGSKVEKKVSKKISQSSPGQVEPEKQVVITSPIGPFSAFKVRPKGVRFHEQDDDEEVLLILRKHFITNVHWILFGIILLILPFFLAYLTSFTDMLARFVVSTQMIIVLTFAYYLLTLCYIFVSYITWYYNADLITNKKVVDVHFQDIIYHHVSMTKLNLIEDVNYVQAGFFGSIFSYGDVFIETAGKSLRFEFMSVPSPERVINLLENLIGGGSAE